ncbi:unnamed protein product [Spodoptera exigua]|nr:unnamed protein product [Spodoptera exigua]
MYMSLCWAIIFTSHSIEQSHMRALLSKRNLRSLGMAENEPGGILLIWLLCKYNLSNRGKLENVCGSIWWISLICKYSCSKCSSPWNTSCSMYWMRFLYRYRYLSLRSPWKVPETSSRSRLSLRSKERSECRWDSTPGSMSVILLNLRSRLWVSDAGFGTVERSWCKHATLLRKHWHFGGQCLEKVRVKKLKSNKNLKKIIGLILKLKTKE